MQSQHRFTPCPDSPNCVSSQAPKDSSRYVAPFAYKTDPASARAALLWVLNARSNVRIAHSGADFIHAVFTTPLGFADDVTLAPQDSRKIIDVKSASRIGYYDFGKNGRRVAGLRSDFKARLSKQ